MAFGARHACTILDLQESRPKWRLRSQAHQVGLRLGIVCRVWRPKWSRHCPAAEFAVDLSQRSSTSLASMIICVTDHPQCWATEKFCPPSSSASKFAPTLTHARLAALLALSFSCPRPFRPEHSQRSDQLIGLADQTLGRCRRLLDQRRILLRDLVEVAGCPSCGSVPAPCP